MLTLCSDAWGFLLDGELSPGGRRTHALGLPPSVQQELAGFSGLIFPQRPVPPQPLAPAPARIAQRSAVGQASQQVLWIRVSLLCLSSRQDPPLMFAAASPALRAAAAPPAGPAAALPSPRPYPSPHFVQLRQSGSGSIPGPEAINFQFCHSQLLWDEVYLAYVSYILSSFDH